MDTCCGLDVHKDSVFACILDAQGERIFEKRYGTLTPDLTELRNVLKKHGCSQVAMESTSIYWMPIWRVLQSDFSLKLANPYFIKQLPGRKSDVKDAQWIAECLQKKLIKGSFVPDEVLQQMRQLTRQCRRLTKSQVRIEQQLDNQLQRCNIRFSNYVSNQGNNVSLRKIIRAIIGGERSPVALNRLVHGRTKNRHGAQTVSDSLDGVINDVDVEMLRQCMEQIDLLDKQQAACLTHLEELAEKYYAREISLLCTIPSIQKFSALCILSEIGNDMDAFSKANNLVGWAGLRPRNDESAGKIQSRKTLHGNKYKHGMAVYLFVVNCFQNFVSLWSETTRQVGFFVALNPQKMTEKNLHRRHGSTRRKKTCIPCLLSVDVKLRTQKQIRLKQFQLLIRCRNLFFFSA
jgi:transposase